MDKDKEDDSGKLELKTEYRTEIVCVPTADLFASMPTKFREDWEWDGTQPAPTEQEIAELLDGIAGFAEILPAKRSGVLSAFMEGRAQPLTGIDLKFISHRLPMRIDSVGPGSVRLTLPAEILEAWPTSRAAASLPERLERLASLERSMDALANLYGAIRLDDARAILRGFGLWNDARDEPLLDRLELRTLYRTDDAAVFSDGIVYFSSYEGDDGLDLKEAKELLRFTDGFPRWIPATAEELLAWSDSGYVEDTPANAAVTVWTMENLVPDDPEAPRAMVGDACRTVRSAAAEDPYIDLFDADGDGEDDTPPPALREQFIASQRRWVFCGNNEIGVEALGDTPEMKAWFSRHREGKVSRHTGKEKNKKSKQHGKRR